MAAVTSINLSPSAPKQPELELKSVFGEGREGRWEKVQTIFKEQIEPLYGSQDKLLKELPKSENLKTRLLVAGKDSIGVLVYQTATEDRSQKQLGRFLEIKTLYAKEKIKGGPDFLLKHVLEIAKEHNVDSLCMRISKQVSLIPFLEVNKFQRIDEQDELVLYRRKIEDLTRKRKPDEPPPSERHQNGKEEIEQRHYRIPHPTSPHITLSPAPAAASSYHPRSPEGKRRAEDEEPIAPKRSRNDKGEKQEKFPEQTQYRPPSVAELRGRFEPSAPPPHAPRYQPTDYAPGGIPKVMSSKAIAEGRELLDRAKRDTRDHIPLKMIYLRMILDGRKTIEGRINNGPFKKLQTGAFVRFHCQGTEAYCQVLKVNRYASFREMLEKEGVQPCLPDVHNLQQAVDIYDKIPGYADKAKQHGVLAIHIRLLR
ncbi:MAG: ASCH domain-containing protein [Verrucomicrobia bacterium]|nr:ASCH domain-containing protein [Verrucomicrobiota bacterium]